jgi:hypothetical protein
MMFKDGDRPDLDLSLGQVLEGTLNRHPQSTATLVVHDTLIYSSCIALYMQRKEEDHSLKGRRDEVLYNTTAND